MAGLDGSYLLEPLMILENSDQSPAIYGQIDGLYRISGQGNSAESIIEVGGINHLVVQDVSRTSRGDYCALRLD